MSSFWNLFMLFVAINVGIGVPVLAMQGSPLFSTVDFTDVQPVEFPDALNVTLSEDVNCGTDDETTLIGQLCNKATIQNQQLNSTQSGDPAIATTQSSIGIGDWLGQVSDFGQMLIFGITLLFGAVTGGFIIQVITSGLFASEIPSTFIIGMQVFIGLMWLSFFFKHVLSRQLNPAE